MKFKVRRGAPIFDCGTCSPSRVCSLHRNAISVYRKVKPRLYCYIGVLYCDKATQTAIKEKLES